MLLKKRQTSEERAWQIIDESDYGILSMIDNEGKPYSVPLNIWRVENKLYFHSSEKGLKAEFLKKNKNVSICFVSYAEIDREALTTKYSSACVSGEAYKLTESAERLAVLKALCDRYDVRKEHPDVKEDFKSCMPRTAIWCIEVSTIVGKEYR